MSKITSIIFILLIAVIPVSADVTIDPDGTGDYATIQEGIDAITAGETVWLVDGTYTGTGNKNLDYGGKNIAVRSLNDIPEDCLIDCENDNRGFNLHNDETNAAVIRGMTIRNGSTSNSGGGIRCDGAAVSIRNCIITGNTSGSYHGGGIYLYNASGVIVSETVISNNSADEGGGIYLFIGSLEMTNCNIVENTSIDYGGGIFQYDSNSSITVTNCTVSYNSSSNTGGGIASLGDAYLSVINSIVYGNTASSASDEIRVNMGNAWVYFSDIGESNCPDNVTCNDCMFNQDPMFNGGSPFDYHLDSGSPCIDAGTGDSGTFPTLPGIDIDFEARPYPPEFDMGSDEYTGPPPTPTFTPSNTPSSTPTSTPTITPTCGIYDFTTDFSTQPAGSALYGDAVIDGEKLILTHNISNHTGTFILSGNPCVFEEFSISFDLYIGDGGSTGADGFSLSFAGDIPDDVFPYAEEGAGTGLIVSFDTYDNGGETTPDITLRYAGSDIAVHETVLRTSSWVPIRLVMGPTGRANLYYDGILIFNNIEVIGYSPETGWRFCFAARSGGQTDNQWIDNLVLSNIIPPTFTPSSTPTPTNTPTLTPTPSITPMPTNTPTCMPGDIFLKADGTGDFSTIQEAVDRVCAGAVIWLEDGTYTGPDNAEVQGYQDISIRSVSDTPSLCIIDGQFTEYGFDFDHVDAVHIRGITVRNCDEPGIEFDYSSGTISNCVITGNTYDDGGGIYLGYSSVTISDCIISENIADDYYGGGIYGYEANITVTNSTITGNTAYYYGGGIYVEDSDLTLANSIVSGNEALYDFGGGICSMASTCDITNSTISNNTSEQYGGGISVEDGDLTLTNCTISGNQVLEWGGGGLYLHYIDTSTITNCTFTGNSAVDEEGGGMLFEYGGICNLVNCVFWGNNSTSGIGPEIAVMENSTLTIDYNDIQGGQSDVFVGATATLNWGAGIIDADPLFAGLDDFHLLGGSPCIDTGTDDSMTYPSLPWDDIDGEIRPAGSGYDMGSDEAFSITPTPSNTPTITPSPTATPTPTQSCIHHGDANLDGTVTAGDAQMAFNIALGLITPTYEEECAADCNADGTVTAGDAQQIFGVVMGTDDCVDPL